MRGQTAVLEFSAIGSEIDCFGITFLAASMQCSAGSNDNFVVVVVVVVVVIVRNLTTNQSRNIAMQQSRKLATQQSEL
jgi:Na+-transporting methylmalonyl-CoA/oxaloacetate decarboxylase beta subunit